jgi:Spy/CpxP family protein refolding chaperone
MKPTFSWGPRILALLLIAAAVGAVAASQSTNPPKWWQSEQYQRELGLKPEQSRKIEDIFQQAAPGERTLKLKLDEAEAQFERIVASADEKTALEQIERVVKARADLMQAHSVMLYHMRKVLTPEQWTKLGLLIAASEQQKTPEKPR